MFEEASQARIEEELNELFAPMERILAEYKEEHWWKEEELRGEEKL
jgi:hypothetical protein